MEHVILRRRRHADADRRHARCRLLRGVVERRGCGCCGCDGWQRGRVEGMHGAAACRHAVPSGSRRHPHHAVARPAPAGCCCWCHCVLRPRVRRGVSVAAGVACSEGQRAAAAVERRRARAEGRSGRCVDCTVR